MAEKKHELSPTMLEAQALAAKYGGQLERYPGGFWSVPGISQWSRGYPFFGTTTVHAMVKRGVATYCEFRGGRNGDFPVKVRIDA
jgi:hypothetical protein